MVTFSAVRVTVLSWYSTSIRFNIQCQLGQLRANNSGWGGQHCIIIGIGYKANTNWLLIMTDFTKKVSERVKTFKCSQGKCRSNEEDNLEIIVFGEEDKAPKRGFMCSCCFLDDHSMTREFKEGRITAIPIGKFMKKLNEFYEKYRSLKESNKWQPNINEAKIKEMKDLLAIMDNELSRKINEILSGVYKEIDVALGELSTNNKDTDFEKIAAFLKNEGKTIDVSENLVSLADRIVKLEGQYSYSREEQVRQGNERIAERITKIIKLADATLTKLIDLQKKQIQFILS